jgi:zinc transport system substrate-binding protein
MKHNKPATESIVPVISLIIILLFSLSCGSKSDSTPRGNNRINVIVSILPQKYFVERIGGDRVTVHTIVLPGQSPATYEVTPQQMVRISSALLYFRIGVPFENTWSGKIADAGKNLKVIDTRKNIPLREIESFRHVESVIAGKRHRHKENHEKDESHHHRGKDPHIWLDPVLVITQAETIARELIKTDPPGKELYMKNLRSFISDLRELDGYLKKLFKMMKNKNIIVFHPSWGYFTDRYGMNQIPVEIEGREPGQKELSLIINFMKREKSRVIFVQKQFSTRSAETIATAVKGRVVKIDPLAENYIENLKEIGKTISEEQM